MERKLIRSGTGWCAYINNTVLQLIEVDPEVDMVKYRVVNNELIISKGSSKKQETKSTYDM